MGFFGGLIFGLGIFWGFVESPRDFWVLIFVPFDHPRHFKSGVPPRMNEKCYSILMPSTFGTGKYLLL